MGQLVHIERTRMDLERFKAVLELEASELRRSLDQALGELRRTA